MFRPAVQKIVHFASRDAMNIEGLGPAIIEVLLEKGLIKEIADLYYLHKEKKPCKHRKNGKKSVENLLASIEKSKQNNIDRLIFGFGIRHIGLRAAQLLSENFESLDALMNASRKILWQYRNLAKKWQKVLNNSSGKSRTGIL